MAIEITRVSLGILPPTINTTPNSPKVWANPNTPAVKNPRLAKGTATVKKASFELAPSVLAASINLGLTDSNALCSGCTTNGKL